MRILRGVGIVLVAGGMCLGPRGVAAAGKYDGSVPMLCVPSVVTECGSDGECRRGTAESVNLPQFLTVDLKAMKVHAEGTGRESPIRNLERLDGTIIIQGGQSGRGWTMTISEETGRMSSTISTDGEGFIIFGACNLR
jgi:hypothetical protein